MLLYAAWLFICGCVQSTEALKPQPHPITGEIQVQDTTEHLIYEDTIKQLQYILMLSYHIPQIDVHV